MHRCHTMVDEHKPMICPCALASRRVEENSKVCSSPNACAIFVHTWTSASTYCLAHRDALAIRVTARGSFFNIQKVVVYFREKYKIKWKYKQWGYYLCYCTFNYKNKIFGNILIIIQISLGICTVCGAVR